MSYFALSGLTGCIFPNSGTSSYYDVLFNDQNIISIYKKNILPNINNNWQALFIVEIVYEKSSQIFKFNNEIDRNIFYSFIQAAASSAVPVGGLFYKGGYDPTTNTPDLTGGTGISIGDMYVSISAGTFFSESLEIGDILISEKNNPTTVDDWTFVQQNLDAPEIKVLYESNPDTNCFSDVHVSTLGSALQPGDALTATTTITDLSGYTQSECDANFLSASTSFYTEAEADANFLSASTSLAYIPLAGSAQITGDLIPATDGGASLGSAANQWKELYVSGGTIHMGGTKLSMINGVLSIDDMPIITGDFLSASTSIGDLNGYTKSEINNNFLSANTSFYTQDEADANFLSANTYRNCNIIDTFIDDKYDLLSTDYIIIIDSTSATTGVTINIPTAQLEDNRIIKIKDNGLASSKSITILCEGGELIDGSSTAVINKNYNSLSIVFKNLQGYII
ncbi:hypothetical protein M0Q97_09745 [Candidatus Dojkabacteria bacterium]|jgi:hypothetical protein|nr:hypothetical protein [Candidatus Dojkabacteria bacterium]